MKKLTQEIFDNAPNWAKSAAVDEDGRAFVFDCKKSKLSIVETVVKGNGEHINKMGCKYSIIGNGYDTTNWQQSAIDRELSA